MGFQRVLIFLFLVTGNVNAQLIDTLVAARPYDLHFRITKGSKTPLLFESGGGMDASQWDSIATVLHNELDATVITYDRAGFGKSTLDTANYSILQEIKSLETALASLGYDNGSVVLVGHSLGGFYNRVFAARHPGQVKGGVMLDPRIPSYEDMAFARNYFKTLDRKDFESDYLSLYHLLAKMERNSDYVRQLQMPTHIPILVVMAEKGPFTEQKENERFQEAQRNFVKTNDNRRLVVAEGSSHNIPSERPGLVIELIKKFYSEVSN
ncbi:alpha/beta fold hydrolase [Dyadobacter sp. MSC1_007]|jgi:pimeloyl-ACP methyl ester carboxylesterase|uniref:alpha/beta fold hydrolase n=1 Tax=Dyadobacter sp. MSC1_007 TaxID=2909264 RepID=UPI002030BD22|nr:alpha/beta hydrolase [Dyadobacter sp. MSC1_007]